MKSVPCWIARVAIACATATFLCIPLSASSLLAAWNGSVETKDGVPHVKNPATPIESPTTIELEEQWRRGVDESEEIIFALLEDVAVDADGNVYALDGQLSEVQEFTPDGEYIRSIGRRGEGPGEFNMPRNLFVTPEGLVGVVQSMPGKIVLLTTEGDAAGTYPLPGDDPMMVINSAQGAGEHVFLHTRTSLFGDDNQFITDVEKIVRLGKDGSVAATLAESKRVTDFTRLEFTEKGLIPFSAWAGSADGRTYVSDDFDEYLVRVWSPDGKLERVITREFEPRVRSEDERKRRGPMIRVASGDGEMKTTLTKSETDRTVLNIFPRENGGIWVLSSRGAFDTKDGELCTLDEFDAEGRFVRQIVMRGDGDLDGDAVVIAGNRVFLLTDRGSARAAMMAQGSDDEDLDDAAPMSLICYEIPDLTKAEG